MSCAACPVRADADTGAAMTAMAAAHPRSSRRALTLPPCPGKFRHGRTAAPLRYGEGSFVLLPRKWVTSWKTLRKCVVKAVVAWAADAHMSDDRGAGGGLLGAMARARRMLRAD